MSDDIYDDDNIYDEDPDDPDNPEIDPSEYESDTSYDDVYYQKFAMSPIFNTSVDYIKYKIYVYNYHTQPDPRHSDNALTTKNHWANSSTTDLTVDIFRTQNINPTPYKVTTYVRIDGVDYTPQTYNIDNIPENVSPFRNPYIDYEDSKLVIDLGYYSSHYEQPDHNWHAWYDRLVIQHELDYTKIAYIEARVVLQDPTNDEVVLDTGYNGFERMFNTTIPLVTGNVTMSLDYLSEQNIAMYAQYALPWPGVDVAPYPIPAGYDYFLRDHAYSYWWYSIDDGAEWTPIGWKMFDIYEPTFNHSEAMDHLSRYCNIYLNIRELSPNTEYNIVFASSPCVLSEADPPSPQNTIPPPDPSEEPYSLQEYSWNAYRYSPVFTVKTDGVMEPLPFNISDTGLFRRISLYEQDEQTFETNGIGSMVDALECKVTEELNGMFELEMLYPVDGRHFEDLDFGRLLTANPNQYTSPQPFRIYAISKPHDGKVTVNAAHISYDLSNLTVKPFKSGSIISVMSKLKYGNGGYADSPSNFMFWTDMTTYGEMKTYKPMTIRSVLGGGDESVLGIFGGEYEFNGYSVRLWKHRGTDKGVTIRYGKNLTSLKQDSNCNNMFTGVRPYWYKESDGTAETGLVTCGIIEIPGIFNFTKTLLLDLSSEFDNKPTELELATRTEEYIVEHNLTQPEVSLSVSFVQLSDSAEYADIKLLETVKLGDYVTVQFPKLGIDAKGVEVVKTVFNVLSQRYDSIELGSLQANLTSTISNNSISSRNAATYSDVSQAIISNKDSTSTNQRFIVLDYETYPARLLVMDNESVNFANNVFCFSYDGWSYSSNGVEGPYTPIMPIDASSFSLDGTVNCVTLNQTTATMEVKNDHILKIKRW